MALPSRTSLFDPQPVLPDDDVLKPSEALISIRNHVKAGTVPFMWGPPGCAKSAIMRMVATALNMAYADIRMGQIDFTDLRGIPYPVIEHGVHGVKWSSPFVLPRNLDISAIVASETDFPETIDLSWKTLNPLGTNNLHYVQHLTVEATPLGHEFGVKVIEHTPVSAKIAFYRRDSSGALTDQMVTGRCRVRVTGEAVVFVGMDEFSSAAPENIISAYELTLDRRCGEYHAPPRCFFMAAGNREKDGAHVFRIGSASASRFIHFTLLPDLLDWIDWAMANHIHPSVVGFLLDREHDRDMLFEQPTVEMERGFRCPRTWELVSKYKYVAEQESEPRRITRVNVNGAVGPVGGLQYSQFCQRTETLPDADAILDGSVAEPGYSPHDIALSFDLITKLCYRLKQRAADLAAAKRDTAEHSAGMKAFWQAGERFLQFLYVHEDHFSAEIIVMAVRQAIHGYALPFNLRAMPTLKLFTERHRDQIAVPIRSVAVQS